MEINKLNEKPIPKFFKNDMVFSLGHFIKHVDYNESVTGGMNINCEINWP